MKNHNILGDLVIASGAPGLLALGFLFDSVLRLIAPEGAEQLSQARQMIFLAPLFELLLMCALVGLIWVMNTQRGYGRVVSATYLVLGILVLYAVALMFVLPLPDPLYALTIYVAPGTMTFQAGAAAAALGLISLFFWNSREPAAEDVAVLDEAVPSPEPHGG